MTEYHQSLAALAVQYWKLCVAFERELGFVSPDRVQPGEAQLRFSRRRLDSILEGEGLRLATYDGQSWTSDIPASPVNAEDISDAEAAIVDMTIEPTIIRANGIVHPGKVTLREL